MSGKLIFISGSSGSGKTTLINETLKKLNKENLKYIQAISHTSREKRINEVDGKDYYFKPRDFFEKERDNFLEVEEYCGNFYGTHKDGFDDHLKNGFNVVKIIDVVGAMNIKSIYPNALFIFIKTSKDIIRERMIDRGDPENDINKRLIKYDFEQTFIDKYDLVVRNENDLKDAVGDLFDIFKFHLPSFYF